MQGHLACSSGVLVLEVEEGEGEEREEGEEGEEGEGKGMH